MFTLMTRNPFHVEVYVIYDGLTKGYSTGIHIKVSITYFKEKRDKRTVTRRNSRKRKTVSTFTMERQNYT